MFDHCTDISPELRNEQACKQFAIISFPEEDETLYIVASRWLEKTESSDFHLCSWPPYKGDARIKVAVIENEVPSNSWSKCNARLIKQCSTYESAEEILKAIETVSIRRSETLFQKKHKQIQDQYSLKKLKMAANSFLSQVDLNSSLDSCNSSQSGPFICAIAANADEHFLHDNSSMTTIENSRRNSLSIRSELESSLDDASRLSPMLSNASNEREDNRNLCHNSELNCQIIEGNFQLHVLKCLNEIKKQVAQNSYKLNEFNKQFLVLSEETFVLKENLPVVLNDTFKEVFPFSSAKDLQQFDLKLKDKNLKKKLIRHFSKIGGQTVAKCTVYLLNLIMKPSAAVEFSWFGKAHGKKAFYNLEIVNAIQETVRIHFENATDLEIMKTTQDWFRHAKEKLVRSLKARS